MGHLKAQNAQTAAERSRKERLRLRAKRQDPDYLAHERHANRERMRARRRAQLVDLDPPLAQTAAHV
jgi:hypothetical protein